MPGTPLRFPTVALLKSGFLKSHCMEAEEWTCAECGSPRTKDGLACGTCFSATTPISVCSTCRERLTTFAVARPRACLSQQAYEGDLNRAPIFSRPEQVLWGLKVTEDAALEVIDEADLERRLAAGTLSSAVLVSRDFGNSWKLARKTPAFADAIRRAPATGGFVRDQVWAAIERVPQPPEPRVPDIGAIVVTPLPLPSGVDRNAEYQRRAVVCSTAQHAYDVALGHMHQLTRESRFSAKRKELKGLQDDYEQLPAREKAEIASAIDLERQGQIASFLATCRIETANIPGVGVQKKTALRAYGIATAAEITRDRVDRVRGFGPELTAAVMAWRRSCEDRFVFSSKLTEADREAVRHRYASRRRELEAALIAGLGELQGVAETQQRLSSSLMTAALALAQAQADLDAVSPRLARVLATFGRLIGSWLVVFVVVYALVRLSWGIAQEWQGHAPAGSSGVPATNVPTPAVPLPSVTTPGAPSATDALVEIPSVDTTDASGSAPQDNPESQADEVTLRTEAPSFDCANAKTEVEFTICASARLSAMDVELASLYFAIIDSAAPAFAAIRQQTAQAQKEWLVSRNACGQLAPLPNPTLDVLNADPMISCLEERYTDRLGELRATLDYLNVSPFVINPMPELGLAPPAPVRVGGNIKPPQKTHDVRPVYPPIAQLARQQGIVIIEATIGPDGMVKDATVLRSIPLLDQAAIDAVRQWQFTPTVLEGVPVPVVMTITVQFTLQ